MGVCMHTYVLVLEHLHTIFTQLKPYFNFCAVFAGLCLNFFEICTVAELSKPTIHGNKILVAIFLTVKATILDTHTVELNSTAI